MMIIIIIIIIITIACVVHVRVQVCSVSTRSRSVTAVPRSRNSSRRLWPSLWPDDVSTICGREDRACRRRRSVYYVHYLVYAACTLSGISASSPYCAVSASTSSTGCRWRHASRNTSSRADVAALSMPWRLQRLLGAILLPRCAGLRASTASSAVAPASPLAETWFIRVSGISVYPFVPLTFLYCA